MNKKLCCFAIAAVLACACENARADLLVTYQAHLDGKPINAMLPTEAKHMVEHEMQSTIMVRGTKTRIDVLYLSYIVDNAARKALILNNTARKYYVAQYDPDDPGWFVPTLAGAIMGSNRPHGFAVVYKAKQVNVSGIKCREYGLSAMSAGTGPVSRINAVVDASSTFSVSKLSITPFADYGLGHISGVPVVVSVSIAGGPADGAAVQFAASRVETNNIDDSEFDVPAGFTETKSMPLLYLPNPLGGPTAPAPIRQPG